jgi:hypothetical protein
MARANKTEKHNDGINLCLVYKEAVELSRPELTEQVDEDECFDLNHLPVRRRWRDGVEGCPNHKQHKKRKKSFDM